MTPRTDAPERIPPAEVVRDRAEIGARATATIALGPAGDVVDAAVGALSVAAAAARSAVVTTARVPRAALRWLPVPPGVLSLGRRAVQSVEARGRAERALAVGRLFALADVLVPRVVREILVRLDVAGLVREFVDLDRIVAGVDVDAVVADVDVAAVVERLDLDAVLAGMDLNALLDRVDIDRLVRRIDIDQLVGRIDIDRLVRRIEIDQLVRRIDIDQLVGRIDIDQLVRRIDIDQLVGRIDIDQLVGRIDIDGVVGRIELDDAIDRIDLDEALDRIDLAALLERVDVDRVAGRIDVAALLERIDLDDVLDRVDLDRLIERLDVIGLARYVVDGIDLPEIIRSSTGSLGSEMARGVRSQGADADQAVERVVDRLLMRRHARRTAAELETPGGREAGPTGGPDHDHR